MSRRFQDAMPDLPLRIELLPTGHGLVYGEVRKVLIPVPHHHVRAARQPGMHGVLPQEETVFRVHCVSGNAADEVARVYVFNTHLLAAPGEVAGDLVAQEDPDVGAAQRRSRQFLCHRRRRGRRGVDVVAVASRVGTIAHALRGILPRQEVPGTMAPHMPRLGASLTMGVGMLAPLLAAMCNTMPDSGMAAGV